MSVQAKWTRVLVVCLVQAKMHKLSFSDTAFNVLLLLISVPRWQLLLIT